MTDIPSPNEVSSAPIDELPYREVSYGRIYDKVEANKAINIAAMGKSELVLDEEKLDIAGVTLEALEKGWEKFGESFTKEYLKHGKDLDPFTVFKYYHLQRKTFQTLGRPTENASARDARLKSFGDRTNVSETVGHAMCSEYAILSCYLAQKIGEPARLIMGASVANDEEAWREPHAFVWIDGLNMIFDSAQAVSDNNYPALMIPTPATTLQTLEEGHDVKAQRLIDGFTAHYGLESLSFGLRTAHNSPLK